MMLDTDRKCLIGSLLGSVSFPLHAAKVTLSVFYCESVQKRKLRSIEQGDWLSAHEL